MHGVLIQPTVETLDDYVAFAVEYDLGFELVDFADPAVLDGDLAAVVDHYKSFADQERLVSAHGPFLDLYLNSPDSAIRRVAAERIGRTLAVADELGVQFVVFHTNCLPMITHSGYYENWVRSHVHFWRKVVEEHSTTVVLENMWDRSPEHIARVLDGVGSPRLRACLDTGHHLLFSREPLERWFEVLGENIAYLHLTDNLGDVDSELALGTGVVDWAEVTRLVARSGAQPLAVIETPTIERIRASLRFLESGHVYPFEAS
jgi:sugar phosphate isomerase/epimerase